MADNENTILTEESESTRIINLSEASEMDAGMYFVTDSSNGTRKVPITKLIDADLEKEYAAAPAKEVGELKEDLEDEVTAREESDTAINTDLARKANIDGAYDSMTVGNAEQLVSNQYIEDKVPYLFRTSGGSADIGNREEDTIVGGTVAWNQLVQNGNFATSQYWEQENASGSKTITASNNELSITVNDTVTSYYQVAVRNTNYYSFPVGHKILLTGEFYFPFDSRAVLRSPDLFGGSGNIMSDTISANTWTKWNAIFASQSESNVRPYYCPGDNTSSFTQGSTWKMKNVMLIDLTLLFGSTIADYIYSLEQATAGSGVAKLKSWGFFAEDYYPYDAGSLKSVESLVSHDMVGFNQWDEQWEVGKYSSSGAKTDSSTQIRCKNAIKVLPSTEYYVFIPYSSTTNGFFACYFYDMNGDYVSSLTTGASTKSNGQSVTIPSGCYEMRFFVSASYGTTYKGDICINLSWSGTRNGEYEPYVKHSYPLDSDLTLRGIPKLDSANELYYDGDIYESDGTVTRKYGIVDLGTLDWSYSSNFSVFKSEDLKSVIGDGLNIKCNKYPTTSSLSSGAIANADKVIGANKFSAQTSGNFAIGTLIVKDTSYTDAATFKTAMSGVYLVYELATPTSEEADPYQTPQIVDDWGTEEYVTESVVPVGHITKYPANLRDKLQHLPNLADDDGFYLIQQVGTQMYLVAFHIPKATGLADGIYALKATVSGGTPTYTWESES